MDIKDNLLKLGFKVSWLMPARKSVAVRKPRQGITLFLAVLVSVLLWFSLKMSADYQQIMQIPIKLVNVPMGKVSEQVLPKQVTLQVSGNGWQLRQLYTKMPEMQLNAAQVDKNGNLKLRQFLPPSQEFGENVEYKSLSPEELNLVFSPTTYKWVPIRIKGAINYANSYAPLSNSLLEPRQIQISGAAKWVNQVNVIETELLDMVNINQSFEKEIRLQNPFPERINLAQNTAKLQVKLAQYTEETQNVRVQTLGLPSDVQGLMLDPAVVQVVYQVPLQDYGKLLEQDFKVFVDYRQILSDSLLQWVKPTLKLPTKIAIKDARLRPPHLKYRIQIKH